MIRKKTTTKILSRQHNTHGARTKAFKKGLKDALHVHILPIKWTGNPRVQEVICKLEELPNSERLH